MSSEPITGPTAPGSRDSSGLRDKRSVQSNSSEQLMSQQLQLDWALSEESALKQPCSLPPEDGSGSAPSTPICFEIISESPKSIKRGIISPSREEAAPTTTEPQRSTSCCCCEERVQHRDKSSAGSVRHMDKCHLRRAGGFRLLKVKGLELIEKLAESQPEALIQRRQEVCRAVVREEMLEHFLSTVSHITQDSSERVRSCAKKTLGILSAQQEVSEILAQLQH
ncbi:hypothetical protein GJAV_G00215890 [Gymnothorax javanicus]|nr:hypothetical protein GJAV_G00215890 [Gymnothorax javanicus]